MSPARPAGALYLIDTMGYVFRAYHALPPLTNAHGLPTQAVLGVVNMVRKLIQEAQPAALVAVWDSAGPTFRDERFAEYKANRAPMPETLSPQLPYIRRALAAHRVPVLAADGYEADDIIGTLARKAAAAGRDVVIVSSDKDLLQLVGPRIWVLNPGNDLLLDDAQVELKLGVKPHQVADYLALRGDAVDNIPGAPGIGEKGAQQLISRFGSVEGALEHAAEVERKSYREALQNHREQILMSKELATIHTSVEVGYDPAAWVVQAADVEACRALFTELDFHHLLRNLPEGSAPAAAPAATPRLDAAGLEALLSGAEPVALAGGPEGVLGVAAGALQAGWLPAAEAARLGVALHDDGRHWQWADSRGIAVVLNRLGLQRPPLRAEQVQDVSLLAYLDDPTQSSFELGAVARRLGVDMPPGDSGRAAAVTAQAAAVLTERAQASGQWPVYRDLDLPLLPVLEAMEATGVRLDPAPLTELSKELERRCHEAEEEVFRLADMRFNLNSPQQLAEVLFTRMGLPAPTKRGKSKVPSTAVEVLEGLSEHAVIRPILDFRQWSKLKSTYVDALPPLIRPETGRVHTTFVLTGSATGRLASINPNLQNIPIRTEVGRQIRAAFVPDPGCVLLSADYSQIELRLLAHFSQDPLLLQAFRTGQDVHSLTAAEVFGVPPLLLTAEHRRRAKAVNFGIVYGLSAFGLAQQLGIPQAEAAGFIRRYFERYAGVKAYIERSLQEARREGRVRTLHGRVRPIPNLDSRNPTLRGFAERTAINTPLQGTAADLIKLAMVRLHPQLAAHSARLLLQVHDELVLEAPTAAAGAVAELVRAVMEQAAELAVPLEVEVASGPNWRD
ncbi:MAG TPA: DNA polymerase I, partial [Terriglobales bacterium]|nr:DNA polymerase I [Terriglobales bacterium]